MSVNWKTGALSWFFQTTHHDLWDYDVSAPPVRVNVTINGKLTPIVAQGAKNGYMYVLNAKNGGAVPGFKIPETPVQDLNDGKGAALNLTSPTQPEPQGGAGQILSHCVTSADAAAMYPGFPTNTDGVPITPACTFATPFSDAYYAVFPAYIGGINWNRSSYNPQTNDLYVCGQYSSTGFKNVGPTNTAMALAGSFRRRRRRDDLGAQPVDEQARLAGQDPARLRHPRWTDGPQRDLLQRRRSRRQAGSSLSPRTSIYSPRVLRICRASSMPMTPRPGRSSGASPTRQGAPSALRPSPTR